MTHTLQATDQEVGRYAPSTTGPAHPGTLLAALLCWLDARSRGARVMLRLEDLDPERCRPEFTTSMLEDLAWLGLEWDAVEEQSVEEVAEQMQMTTNHVYLAKSRLLNKLRDAMKELLGDESELDA